MAITHTDALNLTVFGVAGGVLTFLLLRRNRRFAERGMQTQGTVTDLVVSHDTMGQTRYTNYTPRFEFTTPDGRTWSVLSNVSSSPAEFNVGERVRILYNPNKPDDAEIDSDTDLWVVPILFGAASLISLAVGISNLFKLI